MQATELLKQQRDIMRRLAAVSLNDVKVDRAVVAGALEKFLRALKRPVLPIRWARDGQEAHALVARAEVISAVDGVKSYPATFREWFIRKNETWTEVCDEALRLTQNDALHFVRELMHGYSIIRSVPWRLYLGRMTPDRASRIGAGRTPVWYAAGNALTFAARAAAECAWALDDSRSREYDDGGFEEDWFPFVDAYEAGLWLFWLTGSEVIALSRPIVHLNGDQVHAENGPAVYWPEGEEKYFVINGVHVPRVIAEKAATELDPRLILHASNDDVRRQIVRKIGIERLCRELATCIDKQGDYELLMLDLEDGKSRPFLKMKNAGTGAYHVEGVARECRTVASALAWRNQTDVPPTASNDGEVESAYRWYQQGDVTIKPVPKIPHRATLLNHRVLAEGKATAHKHVAEAEDVRLFQHEEDLFMRAPTGMTVIHREDDALRLPPGDYVIGVVRVYEHFAEEEHEEKN
jgi:hypothetical protein